MSDNITYIVYETTNLINGKYYIGVHNQNRTNYLGSGVILNKAIKKHGKENFMRETLQEFNIKQDAYDFERLIVNEEMIINRNCYNICIGGYGGNPPTGYGEDNGMYGKTHSSKSKIKMSLSRRGKYIGNDNPMYGKKHSNKTKKHLSDIRTGNRQGYDNPNSKVWIINGKLFYSAKEAGKFFNLSAQSIYKWCKNIPLCYSIKKNTINKNR